MAKLYLSAHQHQPRLLATTPTGKERYAHDDGATYVVLQPFVLEPGAGPKAGDELLARDYLRLWSAPDLAAGVRMLGASEIDRINRHEVQPCPVPFPPGFDLAFSIDARTRSGASVAWKDERSVGRTSPPGPANAWDQLSGADATGWPAFAALSNAVPPAVSWSQLDGGTPTGPQKDAAVRGLLTVFSAMAAAWASGDPPRRDNRDLVWLELVKPFLAKAPLDHTDKWRAYLDRKRPGSQLTNGAWAYDLLLPIAKGDLQVSPPEPKVSLPSFEWTVDGVRGHPELFLAAGLQERSYLDALWSELRRLAQREHDVGSAAGDLPVSSMLGRLYGFGERIAWPVERIDGSVAMSKRIMTLRPDLQGVEVPAWVDASKWFATNVVSLAGQVIRLPWDPADPLTSVIRCDLSIAGMPLEQPTAGALRQMVEQGFAEIAAIPARTPAKASARFSGPAGVQPTPAALPDRLIFFAARKAAMPRLSEVHAPGGRVLFAVPGALLDVVDPTATFLDRGLDGEVVRNAPRRGLFASEVLNPQDIMAPAKALWHRRSVELAPRQLVGSIGVAYALTLAEGVHPDEAQVETWVDALSQGTGFPEARLWVAKTEKGKGGEQPLGVANLARDADGATLVLDSDPKAAGSLSEMLGFDPAAPKAFQVELAFDTTRETKPLFDVVEWPGGGSDPPELALAKAPLTRLSRSADRLAGALAVTSPVPFDPEHAEHGFVAPDLQAIHFSEANKLRLQLGLPSGAMRKLSDPDAQLPLPGDGSTPDRPWSRRGPVSANGPQAWYWLAEHFDQDTPLDDEAEEDTRFQLWNAPSAALKVEGYLEHQHGHRVELELPPVAFARSVDVVSPADVMLSRWVDDNAHGQTVREPLLQLAEITARGGNSIRLSVRREALQLALAQYDSKNAGPLRAFYRSLGELRDAIGANGVRIAVESWVYDNRRVIGTGTRATLGLAMRPAGLSVTPVNPVVGSALADLFGKLDGDFRSFLAECRRVAPGPGPLGLLYEVPSSTFDTSASMLRARLELDRPAALRADPDWAKGAFIPLAEKGEEAGAALAATAQADLSAYLSDPDSRLVRSISWVEADDGRRAADAGMGPGASKFLVPQGETDPVERVADLFYMPHAFVLPGVHPWLGDRRSTADFCAFLLSLAEDLLHGRPISDRIELPPLATPLEAVDQRRAVRAILADEPDGAVARMLRLFSRVDRPPIDPGAEPQQQLHWHAGEVLDSLDGLGSSRPLAVLRKKLLDEPTLFSSLRAVGIGLFNRQLVRAPDPAPAVNHSTFSSELAELGLDKRMISDRAEVKIDWDRFSAADLEGATVGGEPAYYFLDLLPDGAYDDLVEIAPATYHGIDPLDADQFGLERSLGEIRDIGDASAVRGESVLYPTDPPKRSLAANVVHVFPAWRVTEEKPGGSKRLRTFYLLPERVPPPRARSVDARIGDKLCNRDEISLNFDGVVGPGLPAISPQQQWSAEHAKVAGRLGALSVLPAGGELKSYRRIRAAANPTGPAAHLPVVEASGARAEGWHLLTTYLSHFWFELDLQKAGESWSENLDDDTYEVEVELWNGTPVTEDEQPGPVTGDDPLLRVFRERRAAAQHASATPPKVEWDDFQASLDGWLRRGHAGQTLLDEPPAIAPAVSSAMAQVRRFRVHRPVAAGHWRLSEIGQAPPGGVGAVVSFEVLARTAAGATTGPRYDEPVKLEQASALIRVTVLDTPSRVSRVRLRTVRNWKDVGDDDIPDVAPAFFLAERYSAWKSEGREPHVVDEEDFKRGNVPAAGREIRALGADALQRWLEAIDLDAATVDHGSALPASLTTPVFRNSDTGRDETLWEKSWMDDPEFQLGGMLLREVSDPAFLFGRRDDPMKVPERDLSLAGDPLPMLPANRMAQLLGALRPSRVRSARPMVRLIWRDVENMPVLEVRMPLNLRP